jgi:hypothetical protein
MQVQGTVKPGIELEIKRCYLPGVSLEGTCPKCGAPYARDCEDDYLSYPTVNEPFKETCYCAKCQHEWKVTLRLTITLEVVP